MAVKFDPTKEVPSLELCEKLKELGYPQDGGGWYWRKEANEKFLGLLIDKSDLGWTLLEYVNGLWVKSPYLCGERLKKLIKAPTAQELKKWLPNVLPSETGSVTYGSYNLQIWFDLDVCKIEYFAPFCQSISHIPELGHLALEGWDLYKTEVKVRVGDKTEANAYAKMLIWLAENGYVVLPGINKGDSNG